MKSEKRKIRIAVLDDSEFYNQLLSRELEAFCNMLSLSLGVDFEFESFLDSDLLVSIKQMPPDIAFIDYHLQNGKKGDEITRKLLSRNKNCKVVVITQSHSLQTQALTKASGAVEYIYKDKYAVENACFALAENIKKIVKNA